MIELIDTHAHLDSKNYLKDFDDVLKRAKEQKIIKIINIASTPESNKNIINLIKDNDIIYGTLGIHPHDSKLADDFWYDFIKKNSSLKKIVAIGEVGLDFYYDYSPRDVQKSVFRSMIQIAKETRLPLVIHDRDAHSNTYEILVEEKANEIGGVFHCFSGDLIFAKKIIDYGFYISITGVITYKNAKNLQELIKNLPLDRLLIETDCPYLSPEPNRGKRNEPSFVYYVAEKIAEIKNISIEKVAQETTNNAFKLFKFKS